MIILDDLEDVFVAGNRVDIELDWYCRDNIWSVGYNSLILSLYKAGYANIAVVLEKGKKEAEIKAKELQTSPSYEGLK